MSEGVFLLPRTSGFDQNACKQLANATAFGTAGLTITAKPTRVYKLSVVNSSATRYLVQIFNKASAPVNTDVPVWEANLAATGDCQIDFGLSGLYLPLGFGLAISSTKSVLTLALATDAAAYGLYAVQT